KPGAAATTRERPAGTGRYVEAQVDGVDREVLLHESGRLVEWRAAVAEADGRVASGTEPEAQLCGQRCASPSAVGLDAAGAQARARSRAVRSSGATARARVA